MIGPVATNNLDRPSLRSGTAVPSLNTKERRDDHDHRRSCAHSDGWCRYPPRRSCGRRPRSARGAARHGALRHGSRLATRRCSAGSSASAPCDQGRRRGHRFVWGRPGPLPAPSRRRSDRSRSSQPSRAPTQRQVRSARRRRGRSSRTRGPGQEHFEVQRRRHRSHPGPRRGQALSSRGPDQGTHPDAPSGDHRPRSAARSPEGLERDRAGQRGGPGCVRRAQETQ